MLELESKIGKIKSTEENVYNFLSDFNNFQELIPEDKIRNWESTDNSCHFTLDGIGDTGMRIIEKEPFKLIKITGEENSKIDFNFWIQLKQIEENATRIKLTIKANINTMIQMIAKKPLQTFLDSLVDQLEIFNF